MIKLAEVKDWRLSAKVNPCKETRLIFVMCIKKFKYLICINITDNSLMLK